MRNYLLLTFICFSLSGCAWIRRVFGIPPASNIPKIPDDASSLEFVSTVMVWCAIAAMVFGGIQIAIVKKPMLGFQSFALGLVFLCFGYFLQFVDQHIEIFIGLFVVSVGAVAYMTYRAVTVGFPLWEKITRYDWNNDKVIGDPIPKLPSEPPTNDKTESS